MSRRPRNTLAYVILFAYVMAGVLLEVGHRDVHEMVLDASPVVSTHACGANEIHVPLDKRHDCLACSQSTLRVATAATFLPSNITTVRCFGRVVSTNEHILHTDVLYSGKRGPPVS